jgi:hypothetical protein
MFTGERVDARSDYHKRQDRERQRPQQTLMFPIGEILPFVVSTHPWLKDLPASQLELTSPDPRTAEDIERDLLREAEQHTAPLFAIEESPPQGVDEQLSLKLSQEVCWVGYRLRARRAGIPVRRRGG